MSSSPSPFPTRILTHNIRFASTFPTGGEKSWSIRRSRMSSELRFHTIYSPETFICLQEVLKTQLSDILFDLNEQSVGSVGPEWVHIGVGRDDGKEAGEYSPIVYRKDIWDLLSYETVWLSETPTKPSKGWDGSCTRIVTIGRWKHKRTGRVIGGMNTHLDDRGHVARYEAAKMLSTLAAQEGGREEGGSIPVFLAGDFNSEPNQEAYEYLQTQSGLVDAQTLVKAQDRYGHQDTYTGFDGKERTKRIDFVFVSKHSWEIANYGVLESRFDDGVFNSDHRAVVVDLFLVS